MTVRLAFPVSFPISANRDARTYPAKMPIMNGISFPTFFPYVEQSMVTARVKSPQIRATYVLPPSTLDFIRSPTALPERLSPIIATVGPMMTGGIRRSIHFTPQNFTTSAITIYTIPAIRAPIISPQYPAACARPSVSAPANALNIEPINANELPKNTGLELFVNTRYTKVPTPAPNSAAEAVSPCPTIAGTAIVAAIMARSCCNANSIVFPKPGLSLIP